MQYNSTRDSASKYTASQAMSAGLAPDGGLFVPDSLPALSVETLSELCSMNYRTRAARIMKLFLPEFSAEELESFTREGYGENFDCPDAAPVHWLDGGTAVLELWHGPTCAFKDMALQMLPRLLTASLKKNGETRQVCILVATSGDTGKAALEGFRDVSGTRILVFYPRDGVSDVQKLQMITQQGGNVCVSAVHGNFDDAQTGVKKIFGDREFAAKLNDKGFFLSSANSINWGRLLPQIAYYISAYCDCVNAGRAEMGSEINFCVPTGNFGNILAGWYAKQMGLPVGRFICASNENNVLTDFIGAGVYDRNRPFHVTTSPSMDILVSSNLERLLYHLSGSDAAVREWMGQLSAEGRYQVTDEVLTAIGRDFSAGFCDDARTAREIARVWQEHGYLIDTHTAVAMSVLDDYREATGDGRFTVAVSTASPFKFCDSVLAALGERTDAPGTELLERLSAKTGLPVPAPLAGLAGRATRFTGCVDKGDMYGVVESFLG